MRQPPKRVSDCAVDLDDRPTNRRAAFTLVELLVTMAIIALLLGLLLPTLRAVRAAGRQTLEMSAARQLMVAYNGYANVHNGAVLPGYWPQGQAMDASGNPINAIAARRYPWRIAPYLDYSFRGLYLNENEDLLEKLENEDPWLYRYAVSLFPSLGINGTWIGGDSDDGGFHDTYLEVFGRFYVTRMAEAIRPEQLLVFASARGNDPFGPLDSGVFEGWFRIQSPYFTASMGYRWQSDEFDKSDPPVNYGYLSPRYGGSAVVAFLDSHVGMLSKRQLKDMRYWANQATSADWGMEPQ